MQTPVTRFQHMLPISQNAPPGKAALAARMRKSMPHRPICQLRPTSEEAGQSICHNSATQPSVQKLFPRLALTEVSHRMVKAVKHVKGPASGVQPARLLWLPELASTAE
jgi:hypothetical protein